jgi:hypothetical protein
VGIRGEDQDRASSASGGGGSGRSTSGRQQAAAAHRGSAEVSYGCGSMERMRGTEIGGWAGPTRSCWAGILGELGRPILPRLDSKRKWVEPIFSFYHRALFVPLSRMQCRRRRHRPGQHQQHPKPPRTDKASPWPPPPDHHPRFAVPPLIVTSRLTLTLGLGLVAGAIPVQAAAPLRCPLQMPNFYRHS